MTTFADVTVDDIVKGEVVESYDDTPPPPPPPPTDKGYGGKPEEPEEPEQFTLDPRRIYAGLLIYNQQIIYGTAQEAVAAFVSGYNSPDVEGIATIWNRDQGQTSAPEDQAPE